MEVQNHRVSLTSLGKDGRPGGEGEDADMVGVFSAIDSNGQWFPEDDVLAWIRDPSPWGQRDLVDPRADVGLSPEGAKE